MDFESYKKWCLLALEEIIRCALLWPDRNHIKHTVSKGRFRSKKADAKKTGFQFFNSTSNLWQYRGRGGRARMAEIFERYFFELFREIFWESFRKTFTFQLFEWKYIMCQNMRLVSWGIESEQLNALNLSCSHFIWWFRVHAGKWWVILMPRIGYDCEQN